jgi:hypothetical protein
LNDTTLFCFGELTDYRLTTGTSEHLDKEDIILIYPNPASRKFQIRVNCSDENTILFHLYDLSGKKVMTKNIMANTPAEISFNNANGLFLYRVVKNGVTISTGKLIFNNS